MSTVFSPFPCDDKFRAESIAAYSAMDGYTRMLQKCTLKLHIINWASSMLSSKLCKAYLEFKLQQRNMQTCQNKSWRTQQQSLLTDSDVILNYWNVFQFYLNWSVYKKDAWKAKKMLKLWNSERNYITVENRASAIWSFLIQVFVYLKSVANKSALAPYQQLY